MVASSKNFASNVMSQLLANHCANSPDEALSSKRREVFLSTLGRFYTAFHTFKTVITIRKAFFLDQL